MVVIQNFITVIVRHAHVYNITIPIDVLMTARCEDLLSSESVNLTVRPSATVESYISLPFVTASALAGKPQQGVMSILEIGIGS